MAQTVWAGEGESSDPRVLYRVKRKLFDAQSKYQHIVVYDTYSSGRILILDDAVQLTEVHEFTYHEMIVHPAAFILGTIKNALVIGGGDGGTLREILKHEPKSVDIVEIDEMVINVAKRYFPGLASAYDDHRVNVIVGDGIDYVHNCNRTYDLIIVDSTDPIGIAKPLLSKEFYSDIKEILDPSGIVVAQSGSPFDEDMQFVITHRTFNEVFPNVSVYFAYVPMYPWGMWSFTMGSKTNDLNCDPEVIKNRYHVMVSKGHVLRYYNPEVHHASIAMPNFAQKLLAERTK